jgi:AcrR family transcriptional regulator
MEEKKLSLLLKIMALYTKYGIRSVTMDDIASELGISKKTIYEIFEDKNDIVKQVILYQMRKMDSEFREISKMKKNAIETLLYISDIITRYVSEANSSFNFDLMKYHPEAWKLLLQFKRDRVFNHVKENLITGVKEGLYRPDLNPDVISLLYVSRFRTGMDPDILPDMQFNFHSFFKELLTYHIRGIASEKGIKEFDQLKKDHKTFQD